MAKFLSDNFDPIVSACGFGVLALMARHYGDVLDGDRSVTGTVVFAMLIGAYVGYLGKCFRQGKEDAEADD